MAHDGRRNDAPRSPEFGQRVLHREESRLGEARLIQPGVCRAKEDLEKRGAEARSQCGITFVENSPISRHRTIKLCRHTRVLRALAAEQKCDPAGLQRPRREVALISVRDRLKMVLQLFSRRTRDSGPERVRAATRVRRVADVLERRVIRRVQVAQKPLRLSAEGRRRFRRNAEQVSRPWRAGAFAHIVRRCVRRFLEDDERIGSAYAKAVHRGAPWGCSARPLPECRLHVKRAVAEWNARIRRAEMDRRRYLAVPERERRFDQPGEAGRLLGVTDVRLYRSDRAEAVAAGVQTERPRERVNLDGIAGGSSSGMTLDIADAVC
jgi:hypothetical protein